MANKNSVKSVVSFGIKKLFYFFLLTWVAVLLNSCTTAPIRPVSPTIKESYPQLIASTLGNNIVHVVSPGETLWHISKLYNISIDDIKKANNLSEAEILEAGQRLMIPIAISKQPSIPIYYASRWAYIIIHHSATDEGDVCFINRLHKRKGWCGIGYDFVIDNGSKGKQDGEIEVTERWVKQKNGAHCRASEMNYRGIGICLVGNFSKERVSEKQMNSLVYLTSVLKKYYRIPPSHIMGHGQVPGAKTECPGKYFSWAEFRRKLENYN